MAGKSVMMRALGALATVMGIFPLTTVKKPLEASGFSGKKVATTKGERHRSLKRRANRRKTKGKK